MRNEAILTVFTESVAAGIIIGGLILLVLVLVITGAIGSFFHSYWTLAYLRLTAPTGEQAQA